MAKDRTIIGVNLSVFLLMVGVGLIVALLPERILKLSASVSDVGMLASAYALPSVLLQIPIGNLSDRLGFKRYQVKIDKIAAVKTSVISAILADPKNLVVFSGITIYGAGYGIFITIIPAFLINARNASETIIGAFFALFYVALSVSQFFAGAWSDRNGRKPAMLFGLSITVLGIAVFHQCPFPFLSYFSE